VRHRGWLSLVFLMAGAGLLAVAALAGPSQKRGGTLRMAQGRDVDSLDPAVAYQTGSWGLEFATCAKLYNFPDDTAAEGAVVVPEVADGFPKVSTDGKTQTIQLKRTYRFHTGQRITAANFAAAINRDASPRLQSGAMGYLHEVVGADAAADGDVPTVAGVRVLGPYTLQIRTTTPVNDLISRLTMPFFCPVAVDTPSREITDPLGSGPYYVASYVPNRRIVLERNRFYHGPRPANTNRVEISTGVAPEACRAAIERNEIDVCGVGIPPGDYAGVAARYGINRPNGRLFFSPALATMYFAFNHDRPAFKGPGQIPLAKAINWAIDRHALVQAAGFLGGKRTDQILPPAMARPASIYPVNGVTDAALAKARALLAQAKLRPKTLVLWAPSFPPPGAWAQIFQYDLKRIGIDVQIEYFQTYGAMDPKASVRGAPYDVMIQGWFVDYADPISFFSTLNGNLQPAGNQNFAYFDNPKYNRAIARISRLGGTARAKAWADLDVEMMRDDPPWAPFMTPAGRDFVSASLGCYVYQPVYGFDIAAACKR
jgi:peptide/nickel transport system substrate-binding protein